MAQNCESTALQFSFKDLPRFGVPRRSCSVTSPPWLSRDSDEVLIRVVHSSAIQNGIQSVSQLWWMDNQHDLDSFCSSMEPSPFVPIAKVCCESSKMENLIVIDCVGITLKFYLQVVPHRPCNISTPPRSFAGDPERRKFS
jgi:hypothetical protein